MGSASDCISSTGRRKGVGAIIGFGLKWRDQLPPVVVDEFENLINDIIGHFDVAHDDDGSLDADVIAAAVAAAISGLNLRSIQGPPGVGVEGPEGPAGVGFGIPGAEGLRGLQGPPGRDGESYPEVMYPPGNSRPAGMLSAQVLARVMLRN